MALDLVFAAANTIVVPAWAFLILAPTHPWAARLAHSAFAFLLLAALYTGGLAVAIATDAMAEGASFFTLDGVMALFDSRLVALNGWVHYLAFDLFVGAWIARDALRRGIGAAIRVPALLGTFILGPLGLGVYLIARRFCGADWSLVETGGL